MGSGEWEERKGEGERNIKHLTFPSTTDGIAIIKNVRTPTNDKIKPQLTLRRGSQTLQAIQFPYCFSHGGKAEVFHP